MTDQDEPPDPDELEPDPDGLPGMWEFDLEAVVAECRRITAEQAETCARGAAGPGRRAAGRAGPAYAAARKHAAVAEFIR